MTNFDFSNYDFVCCENVIKKDSRICFYSNGEIEIDGEIVGELIELNKKKGFIKYKRVPDNKYLNGLISCMQIIKR